MSYFRHFEQIDFKILYLIFLTHLYIFQDFRIHQKGTAFNNLFNDDIKHT